MSRKSRTEAGKADKMADTDNSNIKNVAETDAELPKLSDLLDRGWKLLEEIDTTNEPIGSSHIQVKVKRAIMLLEEASRMVAQLDLFSRNEDLEEISTADMKYLLLPAFLGALTMKQTNRDKRLEIVQTAKAYFRDFLRRCKEYNISNFEFPKSMIENAVLDEESETGYSASKPSSSGPPDLVAMAAQRQAKIERYRQRKETEAKLSDVRRAVDSGQADDEVVRDFYFLTLRKWVTLSLEELDSIDQEVEILKRMDVLKQSSTQPPSQRTASTPVKPFILTKDAVQARVFGAGYPSLPIMTVDEWYEQHRKHGALPDQGIPRRVAVEEDFKAKEHEEEEKEKRAENDDEESLKKARDWDEWKDTHPRGYGNRQNMG